VLVFPEGISHDLRELAPLKTGAARMALDARSSGISGLLLLPIGLVYERKEAPGSRVLVRMGEPIDIDSWSDTSASPNASSLTAEIDKALRLVTLNFADDARAERAVSLARALAAIASAPPSLDRPRPLATEVEIVGRIERATDGLSTASPTVLARADEFVARLTALDRWLAARHVALTEVRISSSARHGAEFAVREGGLAVLALPVAALGRVTHWPVLRLARLVAVRPLAPDASRDLPAMRTIVLGLLMLLLSYLVQGAVVAHWFGILPALLWLTLIFFAARVDFALHGRLRRAADRALSYLALRRDPTLRTTALTEVDALLAEALALEDELTGA
jgi:hypothetical protein